MESGQNLATAPPRTPARKGVTSQTAAYFLCFTLVGVLSAMLGPSLLVLAERSGGAPGDLGLLFTVDSFGSVCGSLLAGWLLGRFATHLQAALALAGIIALMLILPLLTRPAALLPAWWALGLCKTFLIVTVNTLLVRERRGTVGPFMNVADFFLGLGSLLMPVAIALSLRATGHLVPAYWAGAVLAVILLVWLLRMLPGPSATVDRPRAPDSSDRRQRWVLPLVAAMLFVYVGAEISFAGWLPAYVADRGLTDATADAAYFTALFWIAVTAGRLLWAPLAGRYAPERLLTVAFTGCAAVLTVLFGLASPTLASITAGTIAFGLFMAPVFPSAFTLLEKRVGVSGKASAVCLCTASVGAMFFPWLVGSLLIF
ncbi:MFS transporter [Streptomyces sp. NPDC059853]|uniref:MFS transporter n=1 Tax=Streptomyces sp. NPDC059853 TaxID=3346973 RepID=UPI0036644E54